MHENDEPVPVSLERRKVRLHMPELGSAVRAVASQVGVHGAMIECELPWLRLGSPVETEVAPGDLRHGLVRWIGVDVASSGAALLRVALDFENPGDDATEAAFFARASAFSAACDNSYAEYHTSLLGPPPEAPEYLDDPTPVRRKRRWPLLACLLTGLGLGVAATQAPATRGITLEVAHRVAGIVQASLSDRPRIIESTDDPARAQPAGPAVRSVPAQAE
ncbi:MAG TPA: hypothetical protein VKN99_18075 [Polyangia bacterium]|nr:hypothetical protein [Polyangia bacterium]